MKTVFIMLSTSLQVLPKYSYPLRKIAKFRMEKLTEKQCSVYGMKEVLYITRLCFCHS